MKPLLPTARTEFLHGIQMVAPSLIATGAWGMVTGVAMLKSALTLTQALGMTVFVYAGSAQLAVAPLIAASAPIWVILLSATVVNLRFVIYAAALSPHFRGMSTMKKLGLGYLSGDISVVIFMQRVNAEPQRPFAQHFLLGCTSASWVVWQLGSLIGIVLASQIPDRWGLDFAGTLALVALAIPLIRDRAAVGGVAVTAAVAMEGIHWPLRLGVIAATAAGIVTAMVVETRAQRASHKALP